MVKLELSYEQWVDVLLAAYRGADAKVTDATRELAALAELEEQLFGRSCPVGPARAAVSRDVIEDGRRRSRALADPTWED